MPRAVGRILLAAVLLSAALGCSGRRAGTRPAMALPPTPALTAKPAGDTAPLPTLDPEGRLPAVLAQVSLGLPEGDAYGPNAAAFDESGQAAVLCYYHGQAEGQASALIALDPARGTRGAALALPGHSLGPLALAAGRAYFGYEDAGYHPHLAALDLGSGRVLADTSLEQGVFGQALAADPAGRLYLLRGDRLEVRDPATLQVLTSLPTGDAPGQRTLAFDRVRSRLFAAVGPQLRAYGTPGLTPLWEAPLESEIRQLVLDRAGERIYVYCEGYEGSNLVRRLLALDAASGQVLGVVPASQETFWQPVAADSQAGYLVFLEPTSTGSRLWQADLAGRPTGIDARVEGYAQAYAGKGRLLVLLDGSHLVNTFDPASLQLTGQVATGVEIRNVAVDAAHGRLFVNDSAGRLHLLDGRTYQVQASIPAGGGSLALDAPNDLLFVGHEPWGREVAVVDTDALTVTAAITGGYKVAVDSAGRRAFVGYAATGPGSEPGEVQVWDTRTFRRLGAIPHGGEPTYNPLRDEVYLRDYSAYVVDGKTLAVTGELTPDIGEQPLKWCNGCLAVAGIHVEPEQDLLAVAVRMLATGGGPGAIRQPRTFSARTRQPITHTATLLAPLWQEGELLAVPPDEGRAYAAERYARYVLYNSVLAYEAGAAQPYDYRDGLSLDYYLPGVGVGLSLRNPAILAYDLRSWEPLGWIPYQPIRQGDPQGRRLYAWERSLLTVLSFEGGQPAPTQAPEPWPAGRQPGEVREIHLSPAYARDRTVFVVTSGQLLRSTDGGESWMLMRGGLLPDPDWAPASYTLAVSPGFERDRTLFVGGYSGESMGLGVWRSTDGGDTWAPAWRGLTHLRVSRLAISPRYPEDSTLLAYCFYQSFWRGDSGLSLFRSVDGGASWALVASRSNASSEGPLPQPEDVLPRPAEAVRFQAPGYGEEVMRSADGGQTWQTVLHPARPGRILIARSPAFERDGQVFVLDPYTLYRSTDGGLTWQAATDARATRPDLGPDFTALAAGLGVDGKPVIFLGDRGGLISALDADELSWAPPVQVPPTPAATPSPTPCAPGMPQLGSWPQDLLGCPSGAPEELYMARQPFERGLMFWLSDRREIYVLYSDWQANRWRVFADTWEEGQADRDPALQPPANLEQPIRGFGRAWREELGGPQAVVGWATEGEKGYTGKRQVYTGGLVLTAPDGQAYALFADGTWLSP